MTRIPPHAVMSSHVLIVGAGTPLFTIGVVAVSSATSRTLANAVSVACRRPYTYADPSVGIV
jgi:hypothetical protein